MSSFKKVIVVGAGGNVGVPILNALIQSGKFDLTVLARPTSSYTAPSGVKLVKASFEDHQGLVDAFKGQEAAVFTFGDLPNIAKNSQLLIDAAIDAGVKRVLPSEYGGDLSNSPGKDQQIFGGKQAVNAYLREKADQGKITYTNIATGPFFDWGIQVGFAGFDVKEKKVTFIDDGQRKFNGTTIGSIGDAVVGVLSNPAATENKYLRVHDFFVTQREINDILGWEVVGNIDGDVLEADSLAGLAKGDYSLANIYGAIKAFVWGKNSNARWGEEDDSQALGLKKKDLREEVLKAVGQN